MGPRLRRRQRAAPGGGAARGCRCVCLEIDRACVDEAQQRAAEQGVAERCRFAVADLMRLPTGAMASGVLDAAAADGPAAAAPPATVALLFITGHMLSRMSAWLHAEWSRGGLRIVTCVEALDECVDFEEGLFAGGGDERTWMGSTGPSTAVTLSLSL